MAAIFHHQEYSSLERPGDYLLISWTPEISYSFKNVNSSILTKDSKWHWKKFSQIMIVKTKLMMMLLTLKIEGCLMISLIFRKMRSLSCICGIHLFPDKG
uniref:Uncharacterized protein n=2 Tax=Setaria italica TaxID=4555 RepID=K3YFQ4_SETIT